MEKHIIGYIYKITNNVNNFIYIGKTTYYDVKRRLSQHNAYAKKGGGSETTLHQAIRDFGIENFSIEIIDTVYYPDILEQKEKEYIQKYHSYVKDPNCKGYNQSKGGEGTNYTTDDYLNNFLSENIVKLYLQYGNQTKVAEELDIDVATVRNYLELNKIEIKDAKTIAIENTGKKVAIYNNNQIIAIYPSLGEAARHFIDKESASHISEVCYGKRSNVKGYTANFTNEDTFNEDLMLPSISFISNKGYGTAKSCEMLDIQTKNVIKTFRSGTEAGRFLGMDTPKSAATGISRSIKNNVPYKGYYWRYTK